MAMHPSTSLFASAGAVERVLLLAQTQTFCEPFVKLILVAHELVGVGRTAHRRDAADFIDALEPGRIARKLCEHIAPMLDYFARQARRPRQRRPRGQALHFGPTEVP